MIKRKGFALIASIFIVMGMTVLALTTVNFISSDSEIAVKNYHSLRAFYVAVAGVERYLLLLQADDNWASPPACSNQSFADGVFSIETGEALRDQITFNVTGTIVVGLNAYDRKISLTVLRTVGGITQIIDDYLIYGGAGGSTTNIGSNSFIYGDLFVDTNLVIDNNTLISGDAYAAGSIEIGNGSVVTGTVEAYSDQGQTFPSIEAVYYDNLLGQAALEPKADWAFGSINLTSAQSPYLINGDITIKGHRGNEWVKTAA
ncbi:MAG: hypothetical protein KJ811_02725 [Candidatus Margulisbacteria bacterium]|nr:hypothetical protein [Candidatus Margulisiibacteriota bacterium]